MRHLLVILLFLMSVQICWADFIDPTDLFNFDEMNAELSKKRHKESDEFKPDESTDGKQEASNQPPASRIEIEDSGDKNSKASGSTPSSSEKENQDDISTMPSSASNKGGYEGNTVVQESVMPCRDETMTKAVFSLFQQFVMHFVQLSQGMVGDSSSPVEFCMRVKTTPHDLSVLRKFGEGDDNSVHAAHEKLTNVFQSVCDLPDSGPIWFLEKRLGLSTTVMCLTLVCLLTLFFIVKALTTIRITRSKIWFAMIAVFITSVAFTWMEMYQKRVADQERVLTDAADVRCPQYEKLSTWERFTNYLSATVTFQDENCREYYEAMFINPITQVSPLEAVAVAVVKTVVAPCKIVGEGVKDLIIGLFKDLPAQYAGLLIFLITVGTITCLIYLPLLMFGYTIRIPLLLAIEPAARPQALQARQDQRERAIERRQERGQGDGMPHNNAIQDLIAEHQIIRRHVQRERGIEQRQEQGRGDGGQQYKALAAAKPQTGKAADPTTPPSTSSQSQIMSYQARALQKCQEESEKKNNLSKVQLGTTSDGKKKHEKVTNLALASEPAPHQVTVSEERNESLPESEDLSFIVLQHVASEESFKEYFSGDFVTPSAMQGSSDEDDNIAKVSEEENLNGPGDCDGKNFEKDLKELNIRDT